MDRGWVLKLGIQRSDSGGGQESAVQRHPTRVATKDALGRSLGMPERQGANVWEIQEERGGAAIRASFPVHTLR